MLIKSLIKFWFNNFGEEYQSVGAQYDGVITNLSKKAISSWELVAPLSETGFIDSSWNGDITLTEDELNVVPDQFCRENQNPLDLL